MKKITIEQFTKEYDIIIQSVESGQSYIVESEVGNVLLIPFRGKENNVDELIKIYTDHEEGS